MTNPTDPNQQWQNQGQAPGPVPPPQQPPQPQPQSGYPPPLQGQPAAGAYQQPTYQASYQQPAYQAPSSNSGCLKAFLIVMGISVVLGIGAVVVVVLLAGEAVDSINRSFGVADASDYEIGELTCEPQEFTGPEASGTITNKSGANQAFKIDVTISEEGSNVKVGDATAFSGALSPGQAGRWSATTFTPNTEGKNLTCKVAEVSYWPS